MTTAQVLLTFFDMSARTHYLNARQTLGKLLDWRVVPVINENDTTTTDEISFGDNDFLAAQVAMLVGADLLVLLTDIDGLLHRRPAQRSRGRAGREVDGLRGARRARIGHATVAARLGRDALEGRGGGDGDGGRDRDRDLQRAARRACSRGALAGEAEGTRFAPRPRRHSCFKLWLKYAKPSQGTLSSTRGAARALREGGTSLLPVGIVEVDGAFDAGDAVEIREAATAVIGKGICNYRPPSCGA